jgi:hypothetical protein
VIGTAGLLIKRCRDFLQGEGVNLSSSRIAVFGVLLSFCGGFAEAGSTTLSVMNHMSKMITCTVKTQKGSPVTTTIKPGNEALIPVNDVKTTISKISVAGDGVIETILDLSELKHVYENGKCVDTVLVGPDLISYALNGRYTLTVMPGTLPPSESDSYRLEIENNVGKAITCSVKGVGRNNYKKIIGVGKTEAIDITSIVADITEIAISGDGLTTRKLDLAYIETKQHAVHLLVADEKLIYGVEMSAPIKK